MLENRSAAKPVKPARREVSNAEDGQTEVPRSAAYASSFPPAQMGLRGAEPSVCLRSSRTWRTRSTRDGPPSSPVRGSCSSSPAERARLQKESDDLQKQLPEPKSDLARKIRELQNDSDQAENSGSEVALFSALLPVMKSFQNEFVASSEKKRSRIRELQDARASLVRKSDYTGYGALALQLIGLMFILARDVLTQRAASAVKP